MFSIRLDIYLGEFLLGHMNMSSSEVMIYNGTQMLKNNQYFGICDSKLFVLQIGAGTFLMKIPIQKIDSIAENMDTMTNIMIDEVLMWF